MMKVIVNLGRVSYKIFKYCTVVGDAVDLYDVVQKKRNAKAEKENAKLTTLIITDFEDLEKRTMGEYTFKVQDVCGDEKYRSLRVYKNGATICDIAISNMPKEEVLELLASLPFTIEFLIKEK